MTFYNPMTTIGKNLKPFSHPYRGKVVQVDQDPYYIGRIKVDIPEIYGEYVKDGDNSTAGILPWIYPRFLGEFSGLVQFGVPEVGDLIEVDFPYQNPYLGYYTNKPVDKTLWERLSQIDADIEDPEGIKLKEKFCGEHYPDVYGHLDRNLTGWYIDKITNEVFIVQGGHKVNIHFDAEGNLRISTPTSIVMDAGENIIMNANQSIMMTAMTSIESTTDTIASAANSLFSLEAPNINTKGEVAQEGNVTVTSGDVVADGISLKKHVHEYTTPAHGAGPGDTTPAK